MQNNKPNKGDECGVPPRISKMTIENTNKLISENEYKNAKQKVEEYEKRQRELYFVGKEIQYKLKIFQTIKWEINEKRRQIIFTGLKDGEIKIGVANCNPKDKFDIKLGKLIAIRRSLGMSIRDLYSLIERDDEIVVAYYRIG